MLSVIATVSVDVSTTVAQMCDC